MMKKHIILIVALCLTVFAQAQRFTSFTGDTEKTVDEMKQFFSTVPKDRQKEVSDLMNEFSNMWNEDLNDDAKMAFIEEANRLIKHKLRPIPHFQSYIHGFSAFAKSDFSDNYEVWVKMVDYHATHNLTQFQKKMELYSNLFTYYILNTEDNVCWKVNGTIEAMGIAEEPYFDFSNVVLTGVSKSDSLEVFDVDGRYYPARTKFQAKNGKVYWTRAGLDASVNAELKDFEMDMRFSQVIAENAKLHYPDLFSAPVLGRLEEKAILATTEDKATYPRFTSYDKTISIHNLYPDVDYIGGFDLRGASIYGISSGDTLAVISVTRKDQVVITARSKSFLIKPTNLLAEDAQVSIYIEGDSIYHPAANFKYDNDNKELLISRPKQGVGRSPFFDSYHKMDIMVESIHWNTNEERIEFKPIVGNNSVQFATFESQNFYEESVMLMAMVKTSPIRVQNEMVMTIDVLQITEYQTPYPKPQKLSNKHEQHRPAWTRFVETQSKHKHIADERNPADERQPHAIFIDFGLVFFQSLALHLEPFLHPLPTANAPNPISGDAAQPVS